MKSLILFHVLILIPFFTTTQNPNLLSSLFDDQQLEIGTTNDLYFLIKAHTQKDNSFDSDWKDVQFVSSLKKIHNIKGRLQPISGQFEVLFNGKIYELQPHAIRAVKMENSYYVPYIAPTGAVENHVFFQVLSDGKLQLLKRFDKHEKAKSGNIYTYNQKTQKIFAIKMKKKEVLKMFGKSENHIINYVEKENLTFDNIKDLTQIYNFYNQN